MAGVKGKSGGARPNSGGARPGAGRKPKERPAAVPTDEADPLQYLIGVMQGKKDATPIQLRAAIAAVQYTHTKTGDGGKKDEQVKQATEAAKRFNTGAPVVRLVNSR